MMKDDSINLSLRKLQEYEDLIPGLAGFPSRILVETYSEFIQLLYNDIDKIIYQLQENPELLQTDTEDRLTLGITNNLRCMGYNASHESKIGGHADLVVKKGEFTWIGEAKIHRDYNYLWEGFQQLTTRYSTGDDNQSDGGLLIYIKVENAKKVIEKWRELLTSKNLPGYSVQQCGVKDSCFFSIHTHQRSGRDFKVRHMPIILYFSPEDKSGRKSKKTELQ
jgi:hypothetical protein